MKFYYRHLGPVFDWLMKKRGEDIFRVINTRKKEEERKGKVKRLLPWYLNDTGTAGKLPPLTEEQDAALRETWKELYDSGIIRPEWYLMYASKTGEFNPELIPSDVHYHYVEAETLDPAYVRGLSDKNYIDVLLPWVKHPPVLVRKIHGMYLDKDFRKIDAETAVDIIYQSRSVGAVIKISILSSGGKGVTFVDEDSTRESIREELEKGNDLHIEQVVRQHPDMEKMNPSSVNTIRVLSILIDGECVPLSSCVRIGNTGSRVDNVCNGGIACGVLSDGSLTPYGFTETGERTEVHPNGFRFSEGKVPSYDKVLETVKRLHYCLPVFGVVSWDICISREGEPVLIEYNIKGGAIDLHQYNNGPVYGEHREKIISQIFSNLKVDDATLDFNFSTQNHAVTIGPGSFYTDTVTIPKELKGNPVRKIGDNAFNTHTSLQTVTIAAELDEIGYCAFYRCEGLKNLDFQGSVKTIGRAAFSSCLSLTEVTLPEGTETIGIRAFMDCRALKSIAIPASVREIAPDAFENCSRLTITADKGSYAAAFAEEHHIPLRLR